ncbi:MAG: head fiber protein [Peptostreptococcaceae bacterium]
MSLSNLEAISSKIQGLKQELQTKQPINNAGPSVNSLTVNGALIVGLLGDLLDIVKLSSSEQHGMMSKEDKIKLDGIAIGATNYTHPNTHPASMIDTSIDRRFVTDAQITAWNAKAETTLVNSSNHGLMRKEDKVKLDGVADNANNYTHPSSHPASIIVQDINNRFVTDAQIAEWNGKATVTLATSSVNGLMRKEDKGKLDGIAVNANNYSLPVSTGSILGGVKIGSNVSVSADGTISVATPYVHPSDVNTRHVTDAQISTWNGKANTNGDYQSMTVGNATRVGGARFNWAWGSTTPTHIWGSEGSSTEYKVYNADNIRTFINVANGANNYVHPNDANTRHVTDTEKNTWNGKATHRNRGNYMGTDNMDMVVGQLGWKNYGNNHTIFDASAGTSPTGATVDKNNPSVAWSSSYPTLMGWNGSSTYGVRVDIARKAETLIGFDPGTKMNHTNGTAVNLTIGKSGNVSTISFPAGSGGNDPGFIKHVETSSNAGYMQFSASDDRTSTDYFTFGSTPGGTYSEAVRIRTDGVITAGSVYNAVWNDYAEYFPKEYGYETEPGDIIALSLTHTGEIYTKATSENKVIVGVHSDCYGHLIGGENPPEDKDISFEEWNKDKFIPVGLIGRIPVKFKGIARKGMMVVPSNIPGVGREYIDGVDPYINVIGFIVEDCEDDITEVRRVKIKIGK